MLLIMAPQCVTAGKQHIPLHAGLTAARVAEPAKVAEVLRRLSLDSGAHYRGDLAALSSDEQAEMVVALQEGGVALGDRSRLRVWVDSEGHGSQTRSSDVSENSFQRRLQSSSEDRKYVQVDQPELPDGGEQASDDPVVSGDSASPDSPPYISV